MRLERQLGFLSCPFDQPIEAVRGERAAPLGDEDEGRFRCLALKLSQCSQFVAADRMRAWLSALDPADMKRGRSEIDLAPFKAANLGGT